MKTPTHPGFSHAGYPNWDPVQESHILFATGAQLRDGFSPAGGQQGRKGQLEAAGEPGSRRAGEGGEKPQLQQSNKAFLNWAAFERNGRNGEAGRGRGIIRGKPHSHYQAERVIESNDETQACSHVLVHLPRPHTHARILLILNFDCFLFLQAVAPAKPSSNSPCSPGWHCSLTSSVFRVLGLQMYTTRTGQL